MSSLRQSNILYNGLNYTIHTGNKGGKYILVNNKKIYIKTKPEYHIYKGNKYIIETGNNGGKYILVNNKKHYLARGGGPEYENLTTKLKEYVQTDKTVQTHIYVHENINPSYFESNKITDEVRKIYFPNIELNEIIQKQNLYKVLDSTIDKIKRSSLSIVDNIKTNTKYYYCFVLYTILHNHHNN